MRSTDDLVTDARRMLEDPPPDHPGGPEVVCGCIVCADAVEKWYKVSRLLDEMAEALTAVHLCRRKGVQLCHACPDWECYKNLSAMGDRMREIREGR